MRPVVLQSILGTVVVAMWIVGFVGLFLAATDRVAPYPYLEIFGAVAMFACMLSFLVVFVYTAMIGTMDMDRRKGDNPNLGRRTLTDPIVDRSQIEGT